MVGFIHHLGLNICVDEYNYRDSLKEGLIEGTGHSMLVFKK